MRVDCPHCHAVFEVPERLLEQARRLKCANCGLGWEVSGGVAGEEDEVLGADVVSALQRILSAQEDDVEEERGEMFRETLRVMPDVVAASKIGSAGAWVGAWGVSLMVLAGGVFWGWKGGALAHLAVLSGPGTLH